MGKWGAMGGGAMGHRRKERSRVIATNGYITMFLPEHHLAMKNGYVYEHRLVAEKKLGRRLSPEEQVHHIDGDKQNNHPDNLEIVSDAEHHVRHRKHANRRMPGEDNPIVSCGCGCGRALTKYDISGRPRLYLSGHNKNSANVSPVADKLLGALADGMKTVSELSEVCGKPVGPALQGMKRKGLVRCVAYGKWALNDDQRSKD